MSVRFIIFALVALGSACSASEAPDASADFAAISDELAALSERIDELDASHQAAITSLQQEVQALSGGVDLTELEESVSQNLSSIQGLTGRVSVSESDIQALGDGLGGLEQQLASGVTQVEANGQAIASMDLRLTGLEGGSATLADGIDQLWDATDDLDADLASLSGSVDSLDGEITNLGDAFDDLDAVLEPLDYLSVDSSGDLVISGTNLQIVSGAGSTDDTATGLGNLIIGYNTQPSTLIAGSRDGAHNLIMGDHHTYTGYASIVAGYENTSSEAYASVLGGRDNRASGQGTVVVGGSDNIASSDDAVVLGGDANEASYLNTVVVGGFNNTATYTGAVVVGGFYNNAGGAYAAVLGGKYNDATGNSASVCGGYSNDASANYSAILGGMAGTTASWTYSSVTGGSGVSPSFTYDVAP